MFARGLATRNTLRAFLLASAALLCSINFARATDVQLTHAGQNNSGNITGASSLGFYQFTIGALNGGGGLGTPGTLIQTFCISQNNFLTGNNFQLRDDLHNLPTPGAAMGALNAVRLVILINELYGNGTNAVINTYQSGTNNLYNIQQSIWLMLAGGADTLINAVDAVLAGSGGTLAGYISTHSGPTFVGVHGLDQYNSGQDQIYWTPGTPNYVFDVPVPAGAVLAGMGIVFVGGFNFLRRRKVVVA